MKKIAIMITILFLFSPVFAEEPPTSYNLLRTNMVLMNYTDFLMTKIAMDNDSSLRDLNPFFKNQGQAFALTAACSALQYWITGELYKIDKTASWILLGALTAAKVYVIIHNFRIIGEK